MDEVEGALLEARRRVLRVVRILSSLGVIVLLFALWSRGPTLVLVTETAVLTLGTSTMWIVRRSPALGGRVFVAMLLPVCVLALVGFGPLMGTGVMFLCWVMLVVFFTGALVPPLVVLPLVVFGCGWLIERDVIAVRWTHLPHGLADWARMTATMWLVSCALGYMFHYLLRAMLRAAHAATEARRAHDAERSKRWATQRLELLGRLSGGVAHDFNNVLTILMAATEALATAEAPEARKQLLAEIDAAISSAHATTRQLLSFSRQGEAPAATTVLSSSLPIFVKSLRRIMPETITLSLDCAEGAAVGIGNGQLEQALLNLCLNARDAMPSGGRIALTVRRDGEWVEIRVRDTGVGMDQATKARAFDPFFSTKETPGLGLALVRETATTAGGTVDIDSAPGAGTTVTLRLRAVETPVTPLATSTTSVTSPRRTLRTLLLEDDPAVQRAFEITLRGCGCDVTVTSTVKEAALAVQSGRAFELFLSDAALPDGNPGAVIRQLRAALPECLVVVCSGYMPDQVMIDGVEKDAFHYLQKPVRPMQLRALITQLTASPA